MRPGMWLAWSVILFGLAAGACSAEDAADPTSGSPGPAGKADDPASTHVGPAIFADWEDVDVVAKHLAVGNGVHRVGTYNPSTFDATAALAAIRAHDDATECNDRRYSTSRASAVAAYDAFAAGEIVSEAIANTDDPQAAAATAAEMKAIVDDPTNRAVFFSLHDDAGNDDPVLCNIFDFYVFRASGTAIHFNFDHAD